MHVEKMVHVLAGVIILGGLALSLLLSLWWLLLPAFVGLSLLIDGLTGFCIARIIIRKILNN